MAACETHSGQIEEILKGDEPPLADLDPPIREILISDLVITESPRSQRVDFAHVRTLQELDTELPPILVHSHTMQVIDGVHRVQAALANGRQVITARLFAGSRAEAYVLAVTMNTRHGLPLSLTERRTAASHIFSIYPEWSDRRIAGITGLSDKTVAKLRRQIPIKLQQHDKRVGRDGRVRPVKAQDGRMLASQFIAAHPEASLREVAKAAGISPNTVRDVRNRLNMGMSPVYATKAAETVRHQSRVQQSTNRQPVPDAMAQASFSAAAVSWAKLKDDPSIRSTDAGRFLLRSLSVHALGTETWDKIIDAIPRHRANSIAEAARQCALVWQNFAENLETAAQRIEIAGDKES